MAHSTTEVRLAVMGADGERRQREASSGSELHGTSGEPVLTHFDASGASRMVDVSAKEPTLRTARASAQVRLAPATLALVKDRRLAKGDVLEVARLAGIMAAKRTGDLIPLCHPLAIESVELTLVPVEPDRIGIESRVKLHGRTGVEMEALTAASVAALTVYDMCKAVDRGMVIERIELIEKTGGRRGGYPGSQ
jgi:cyclic pyranopterin phosphate synthase